MKAIIFSDRASVDAYAAKVDAAEGYPKPGVNIGAGIHAPPEQSITLRFADPIEHPTQKGTFAYPVDELDTSKLATKERTDALAAQLLPADWAPVSIGPALVEEIAP